jgi:hypothetical protein
MSLIAGFVFCGAASKGYGTEMPISQLMIKDRRFIGVGLVGLVGVALWMSSELAGASPLEPADPLSQEVHSGSREVLSPATPPLPFSVDGVLKKNLEFWIRIYTEYSTSQGLIHDAKYVDHVYEVLDLKSPEASSPRYVRNSKRKWKELLLSVHHKRDHPDTLTPDELKVYKLFEDISEPNKFLNAAHRKRLRFQLGQRVEFDGHLRRARIPRRSDRGGNLGC